MKTSSGSVFLYPSLLFCYRSIFHSLQKLLIKPGFFESSEKWRAINRDANTFNDVYDGTIMQNFQVYNGIPFLSQPYNFEFSLNVDWFQPFKKTQHSTGVIFLAIQNLPRSERFKQENIIIVGIMPGPHEPRKTTNSYLTPLVEELKQMWSGVVMKTCDGFSVIVRCALMCVM